jgi:uncharacterized repeat protein (TIGR01451 family)
MSHPTRSKLSVMLIIVLLVGAIGLLTWLLPISRSQAAEGSRSAAFISPIGDPQLSLSKRSDNPAPVPGSLINYTLSYSNPISGTQAFAVRLYDFLPAGVQFLSSNPAATQLPNGLLLFTAPSVGPDTANHDVTVQVRVLEGYAQLANHALVSADGAVPATASVMTTVSHPWGELLLEKSGPVAAVVNTPIVYVLKCQNSSAVTLTDVTVADVLPGGLAFASASPAPDVATVPLLQWSLGILAPGESRSITVTTTAPSYPTSVTNTALASARQITLTTALHSTQVITQASILRVSKTASAARVNVGDTLVYTLHYANIGNLATTGVVLTDTLPAGTTAVAANPPWTSATPQGIVWQIGALTAGASGQIVMTTTVNSPWNRTLTNVADITGAAGSFPDHFELETIVRPVIMYLPILLK